MSRVTPGVRKACFQCPQLLLKSVPRVTESPVLLGDGFRALGYSKDATHLPLVASLLSAFLHPLCLIGLPTPATTCYGFLHSWECT